MERQIGLLVILAMVAVAAIVSSDRFYRGGSPFAAKSSPISIRWSLNLERTLRHLVSGWALIWL